MIDVDKYVSDVDIQLVYDNIHAFAPTELSTKYNSFEGDKSASKYSEDLHLIRDDNGPITINGENYSTSPYYFKILRNAVRYITKEEINKAIKKMHKSDDYFEDISSRTGADIEFKGKLIKRLYEYFDRLRVEKKLDYMGIEKPNYKSKEDYIYACINTMIIEMYIDAYKDMRQHGLEVR